MNVDVWRRGRARRLVHVRKLETDAKPYADFFRAATFLVNRAESATDQPRRYRRHPGFDSSPIQLCDRYTERTSRRLSWPTTSSLTFTLTSGCATYGVYDNASRLTFLQHRRSLFPLPRATILFSSCQDLFCIRLLRSRPRKTNGATHAYLTPPRYHHCSLNPLTHSLPLAHPPRFLLPSHKIL